MKARGETIPWIPAEEQDTEPEWGLPDDKIGALIDVRSELGLKLDSLRAHRTQINDENWIMKLPRDIVETFLGTEVFQRIRSSVSSNGRESDLFEGLRRSRP